MTRANVAGSGSIGGRGTGSSTVWLGGRKWEKEGGAGCSLDRKIGFW